MRDPQILIMDDSASALDFATDARLRKAIRENTKDMTVFIVSQRATTIRNADTILVLDDGKLAGMGSHKQLLKECDVYREICLSQLSKEEVERMSSKKPKMSRDKSIETLKRVLDYIAAYKWAVCLSLLLALVTVAFTLYIPILTGKAVDEIVSQGNVDFAA